MTLPFLFKKENSKSGIFPKIHSDSYFKSFSKSLVKVTFTLFLDSKYSTALPSFTSSSCINRLYSIGEHFKHCEGFQVKEIFDSSCGPTSNGILLQTKQISTRKKSSLIGIIEVWRRIRHSTGQRHNILNRVMAYNFWYNFFHRLCNHWLAISVQMVNVESRKLSSSSYSQGSTQNPKDKRQK